jgi:MULE transposase domain
MALLRHAQSKPLSQLVTIHGKYRNRILPFALCMLRSKENGLYCEMLNQIKNNVHRITGLPLDPQSIVCDFEASLISALNAEFPNAAVRGCYFHFYQSLWLEVRELGIQTGQGQVFEKSHQEVDEYQPHLQKGFPEKLEFRLPLFAKQIFN